jgi:hypothetical protein
MHGSSKQDHDEIDMRIEHLLILQVAGATEGRARERVYTELRDIDRDALDGAIERLERAGVLHVCGDRLQRSPALERIDRLDLIGV